MTRVLVLMGGPDAERAVSLESGRAIAAALREARRWTVTEHLIDAATPDGAFPGGLRDARSRFDVVFPALHGRWGEGGPLQQILEDAGIPFVGSLAPGALLAMDKMATKERLAARGVRTPEAQIIAADDSLLLDPPLVIKPVDDGSSVDLRICRTPAEVIDARACLHPKRGRLLAERYIRGREVTQGVVGHRVLPLIEIIPAAEYYDYEAKYHRDDTQYFIDPDVTDRVRDQCAGAARIAMTELGLRDLARLDFIVDDRGAWLLEVNTMPGFTSHSLVPKAARHAGMEMPALCSLLVDMALVRGSDRVTDPAARPSSRCRVP